MWEHECFKCGQPSVVAQRCHWFDGAPVSSESWWETCEAHAALAEMVVSSMEVRNG